MAFAIFEVPNKDKTKADQALADDQVSRLSIIIKDGKSFGLADSTTLVFVEGSEPQVKRAEELFAPIGKKPKEQEAIREKLKKEEEEAAGGVGFIFG